MSVSCLKRRALVSLVFLLALAFSGCGSSLVTTEITKNFVAAAVQLIKAGNAEETLRQLETTAQQYEVDRNWRNARGAYRVAGLLAESLGNYQKAIIYLTQECGVLIDFHHLLRPSLWSSIHCSVSRSNSCSCSW